MESGFSSLWHCLTFFLGSWARPHARQVSKPHWYIDWRVSQTFNHLKKGYQDLSGAVCEDVLWLADKGKPQKQDESNLAEQFVQKIIRKMSHTSCAQKIQGTHGITFHLALPKTQTYSPPHRPPGIGHGWLFPGRPSEHHGATGQDHSPSSKFPLSHGNHCTRNSPVHCEKASQRGKSPHLAMQWQYQTSSLVGYNWFLELEASLNAQSCAKPMCNDKNQKGHAALLADVSEECEGRSALRNNAGSGWPPLISPTSSPARQAESATVRWNMKLSAKLVKLLHLPPCSKLWNVRYTASGVSM